MFLHIEANNVSPLLQIERSETTDKGIPTAYTKVKQMVYETQMGGNVLVSYPYFSGNGWRGILHRAMAEEIIIKAVEKGFKISDTDFHLLMVGGGANFQSQELGVIAKVRELNPVASLFGISLACEGKLMISDLDPASKMIRETENGNAYSGLVRKSFYNKRDELLSSSSMPASTTQIISEADLEVYNIQHEAGLKESIKAYNCREYIALNTKFDMYIGTKSDLTEIEKGALLCGLEKMMSKRIGSNANLGFGLMEYRVSYGDGEHSFLSSEKNSRNIFAPNVSTNYSDDDKKAIQAYKEWLENITSENIELSRLMVSLEQKGGSKKQKAEAAKAKKD